MSVWTNFTDLFTGNAWQKYAKRNKIGAGNPANWLVNSKKNLSNRSPGVQIPRDICTRLGRYLYSTRSSWIIIRITVMVCHKREWRVRRVISYHSPEGYPSEVIFRHGTQFSPAWIKLHRCMEIFVEDKTSLNPLVYVSEFSVTCRNGYTRPSERDYLGNNDYMGGNPVFSLVYHCCERPSVVYQWDSSRM